MAAACIMLAISATAQNALDAYNISFNQIKGSSRYVAMGGAFCALGGDISSLSQNPAGIGVYRSSEFTLTMGGQWNHNASKGAATATNSVFTFDNTGIVGTFFTGKHKGLLSFNIGLTYNRPVSYNRTFRGANLKLGSSFTNYLECVTRGIPSTDLAVTKEFDAYYQSAAPWVSILGYQSYLISPVSDGASTYYGLFDPSKSIGSSINTIYEDGRNDEYTINFGGNVNDRIYFGAALSIRDLSVTRTVLYQESLLGTTGYYDDGNIAGDITGSDFDYSTYYNMRGTGISGKFGIIARAADFLRLGFAIHTPVYYNITQTMDASVYFQNTLSSNVRVSSSQTVPQIVSNRIKIQTPWSFQAGAAYIIGKKGILSAEYQYVAYNRMKMKENNGDPFPIENEFYKTQFKAGNNIKVGLEYRVTNALSLRAGYAIQLSPVKADLKNVNVEVPISGMQTTYMLPGNTSYYSCGIGYRFSAFNVDLAYQHYYQKSDMFAFSPLFYNDGTTLIPGSSEIKSKQNAITVTLGVRF